MTTSAAVIIKAGDGANSVIVGKEYAIDQFMKEAESWINIVTRYNWSDSYGALNSDFQGILNEAASNIAATYIINYDMSGYTSRTEAELMINLLLLRADEIMGVLLDKKRETFML